MTTKTYQSSPVVRSLLDHAGMADAYDEGVAKQIRDMIRKETGRKVKGVQPWPGVPITHLPLIFSPTMHAMIRSGETEMVSRPKLVDPTKTVSYLRFVK